MNIGVICACLPCVTILLNMLRKKRKDSQPVAIAQQESNTGESLLKVRVKHVINSTLDTELGSLSRKTVDIEDALMSARGTKQDGFHRIHSTEGGKSRP